MTCGGCSGAVTRVLTKAKEQSGLSWHFLPQHPCDTEIVFYAEVISSFAVNLEKQEVRVTGDAEYETVLAIIAKTGKTVSSVSERL
jgi:copper chaperone